MVVTIAENNDSFKLFLKLAKLLCQTLQDKRDRIVTTKWLNKFKRIPATNGLRDEYLYLLLFSLVRNRLVEPFKQPPTPGDTLEKFNKDYLPEDIAKIGLRDEFQLNGQPIFDVDVSGDFRQFVAYQKIPNFGAHFYYAHSFDEIAEWSNLKDAVLPANCLDIYMEHSVETNISSDGIVNKNSKIFEQSTEDKKPVIEPATNPEGTESSAEAQHTSVEAFVNSTDVEADANNENRSRAGGPPNQHEPMPIKRRQPNADRLKRASNASNLNTSNSVEPSTSTIITRKRKVVRKEWCDLLSPDENVVPPSKVETEEEKLIRELATGVNIGDEANKRRLAKMDRLKSRLTKSTRVKEPSPEPEPQKKVQRSNARPKMKPKIRVTSEERRPTTQRTSRDRQIISSTPKGAPKPKSHTIRNIQLTEEIDDEIDPTRDPNVPLTPPLFRKGSKSNNRIARYKIEEFGLTKNEKFVPSASFFEFLEYSPDGRESRAQILDVMPRPLSPDTISIRNSFERAHRQLWSNRIDEPNATGGITTIEDDDVEEYQVITIPDEPDGPDNARTVLRNKIMERLAAAKKYEPRRLDFEESEIDMEPPVQYEYERLEWQDISDDKSLSILKDNEMDIEDVFGEEIISHGDDLLALERDMIDLASSESLSILDDDDMNVEDVFGSDQLANIDILGPESDLPKRSTSYSTDSLVSVSEDSLENEKFDELFEDTSPIGSDEYLPEDQMITDDVFDGFETDESNVEQLIEDLRRKSKRPILRAKRRIRDPDEMLLDDYVSVPGHEQIYVHPSRVERMQDALKNVDPTRATLTASISQTMQYRQLRRRLNKIDADEEEPYNFQTPALLNFLSACEDLLEPISSIATYADEPGILDYSDRTEELPSPLVGSPKKRDRIKEMEESLEKIVDYEIEADMLETLPPREPKDYHEKYSSEFDRRITYISDSDVSSLEAPDMLYDKMKTPPKVSRLYRAPNLLDESLSPTSRPALIQPPDYVPPRTDDTILSQDEMFFDDIFGEDQLEEPIPIKLLPTPTQRTPAQFRHRNVIKAKSPTKESSFDREENLRKMQRYKDYASEKYRKEVVGDVSIDEQLWDIEEPDELADVSKEGDYFYNLDLPDEQLADTSLPDDQFSDTSLPDDQFSDTSLPDNFPDKSPQYEEPINIESIAEQKSHSDSPVNLSSEEVIVLDNTISEDDLEIIDEFQFPVDDLLDESFNQNFLQLPLVKGVERRPEILDIDEMYTDDIFGEDQIVTPRMAFQHQIERHGRERDELVFSQASEMDGNFYLDDITPEIYDEPVELSSDNSVEFISETDQNKRTIERTVSEQTIVIDLNEEDLENITPPELVEGISDKEHKQQTILESMHQYLFDWNDREQRLIQQQQQSQKQQQTSETHQIPEQISKPKKKVRTLELNETLKETHIIPAPTKTPTRTSAMEDRRKRKALAIIREQNAKLIESTESQMSLSRVKQFLNRTIETGYFDSPKSTTPYYPKYEKPMVADDKPLHFEGIVAKKPEKSKVSERSADQSKPIPSTSGHKSTQGATIPSKGKSIQSPKIKSQSQQRKTSLTSTPISKSKQPTLAKGYGKTPAKSTGPTKRSKSIPQATSTPRTSTDIAPEVQAQEPMDIDPWLPGEKMARMLRRYFAEVDRTLEQYTMQERGQTPTQFYIEKSMQQADKHKKLLQQIQQKKGLAPLPDEPMENPALQRLLNPDLMDPIEFKYFAEPSPTILDKSVEETDELPRPLLRGSPEPKKNILDAFDDSMTKLLQYAIDYEKLPIAPPRADDDYFNSSNIFDRRINRTPNQEWLEDEEIPDMLIDPMKTPPRIKEKRRVKTLLDESLDHAGIHQALIDEPEDFPERDDEQFFLDDEMDFDDIFADDMLALPESIPEPDDPLSIIAALRAKRPKTYTQISPYKRDVEKERHYQNIISGKYKQDELREFDINEADEELDFIEEPEFVDYDSDVLEVTPPPREIRDEPSSPIKPRPIHQIPEIIIQAATPTPPPAASIQMTEFDRSVDPNYDEADSGGYVEDFGTYLFRLKYGDVQEDFLEEIEPPEALLDVSHVEVEEDELIPESIGARPQRGDRNAYRDDVIDTSIDERFLVDPLVEAPTDILREDEMYFDDLFGEENIEEIVIPSRRYQQEDNEYVEPEIIQIDEDKQTVHSDHIEIVEGTDDSDVQFVQIDHNLEQNIEDIDEPEMLNVSYMSDEQLGPTEDEYTDENLDDIEAPAFEEDSDYDQLTAPDFDQTSRENIDDIEMPEFDSFVDDQIETTDADEPPDENLEDIEQPDILLDEEIMNVSENVGDSDKEAYVASQLKELYAELQEKEKRDQRQQAALREDEKLRTLIGDSLYSTKGFLIFKKYYNYIKGRPEETDEEIRLESLRQLVEPDLLDPINFENVPEIEPQHMLDEDIQDRHQLPVALMQSPQKAIHPYDAFDRSLDNILQYEHDAQFNPDAVVEGPVYERKNLDFLNETISGDVELSPEEEIPDLLHDPMKTPERKLKYKRPIPGILDKSLEDDQRPALIKSPPGFVRQDQGLLEDDEMMFDDFLNDDIQGIEEFLNPSLSPLAVHKENEVMLQMLKKNLTSLKSQPQSEERTAKIRSLENDINKFENKRLMDHHQSNAHQQLLETNIEPPREFITIPLNDMRTAYRDALPVQHPKSAVSSEPTALEDEEIIFPDSSEEDLSDYPPIELGPLSRALYIPDDPTEREAYFKSPPKLSVGRQHDNSPDIDTNESNFQWLLEMAPMTDSYGNILEEQKPITVKANVNQVMSPKRPENIITTIDTVHARRSPKQQTMPTQETIKIIRRVQTQKDDKTPKKYHEIPAPEKTPTRTVAMEDRRKRQALAAIRARNATAIPEKTTSRIIISRTIDTGYFASPTGPAVPYYPKYAQPLTIEEFDSTIQEILPDSNRVDLTPTRPKQHVIAEPSPRPKKVSPISVRNDNDNTAQIAQQQLEYLDSSEDIEASNTFLTSAVVHTAHRDPQMTPVQQQQEIAQRTRRVQTLVDDKTPKQIYQIPAPQKTPTRTTAMEDARKRKALAVLRARNVSLMSSSASETSLSRKQYLLSRTSETGYFDTPEDPLKHYYPKYAKPMSPSPKKPITTEIPSYETSSQETISIPIPAAINTPQRKIPVSQTKRISRLPQLTSSVPQTSSEHPTASPITGPITSTPRSSIETPQATSTSKLPVGRSRLPANRAKLPTSDIRKEIIPSELAPRSPVTSQPDWIDLSPPTKQRVPFSKPYDSPAYKDLDYFLTEISAMEQSDSESENVPTTPTNRIAAILDEIKQIEMPDLFDLSPPKASSVRNQSDQQRIHDDDDLSTQRNIMSQFDMSGIDDEDLDHVEMPEFQDYDDDEEQEIYPEPSTYEPHDQRTLTSKRSRQEVYAEENPRYSEESEEIISPFPKRQYRGADNRERQSPQFVRPTQHSPEVQERTAMGILVDIGTDTENSPSTSRIQFRPQARLSNSPEMKEISSTLRMYSYDFNYYDDLDGEEPPDFMNSSDDEELKPQPSAPIQPPKIKKTVRTKLHDATIKTVYTIPGPEKTPVKTVAMERARMKMFGQYMRAYKAKLAAAQNQ